MTDITELALLVSKAKASVFTLKYISQFEPADIDSDDVDLRFEVDGTETSTNVSIVDECGQAAKVIDELVEALAAMNSEPVMYCMEENGLDPEAVSTRREVVEVWVNEWNTENRSPGEPIYSAVPLYRNAQQPVGNEFIPKNLDRALGVLGMALPESKEEFNLQSERWIQRLIDRVIRYADEFKEQPAPGDGIEAAAKWIDQQREAYNSEHGWSDPDTGSFEFGNDAQREYSSTLEELAEGIRALHPNAGNSPVIPDTWIPVSERMPECGDYLVTDGSDFDVQMFNGEQFIPGFVWEDKITHWMPLPATPQEVK